MEANFLAFTKLPLHMREKGKMGKRKGENGDVGIREMEDRLEPWKGSKESGDRIELAKGKREFVIEMCV